MAGGVCFAANWIIVYQFHTFIAVSSTYLTAWVSILSFVCESKVKCYSVLKWNSNSAKLCRVRKSNYSGQESSLSDTLAALASNDWFRTLICPVLASDLSSSWPVLKSEPYKLSNMVQFGLCDCIEQLSTISLGRGASVKPLCLCLPWANQVKVC